MLKKIFDGGLILMVMVAFVAVGVVLYKAMPSAKDLVQNEQLRVEAECNRGTKKSCAYLAQVERTKQ